MTTLTPEELVAFKSNYVEGAPDACWEWLGPFTSDEVKIPVFSRSRPSRRGGGQRLTVPRVVYEMTHGPIQGHACVRRKCQNNTCVNPNHLILMRGSRSKETADQPAAGAEAVSPAGRDLEPPPVSELVAELARVSSRLKEIAQQLEAATASAERVQSQPNRGPRPFVRRMVFFLAGLDRPVTVDELAAAMGSDPQTVERYTNRPEFAHDGERVTVTDEGKLLAMECAP